LFAAPKRAEVMELLGPAFRGVEAAKDEHHETRRIAHMLSGRSSLALAWALAKDGGGGFLVAEKKEKSASVTLVHAV